MDTANQLRRQFWPQLQHTIAKVWYALRSPKFTATLLILLVFAVVLRWLIPQQVTPDVTATTWTATLPPWIQPWGELLYVAGFSRIFQSIWFWLPLGLLLLNSLLALADFILPSWRRFQKVDNEQAIEWQHPLAYRIEHSVRLPESPDEWLDQLRQQLRAKGFTIALSSEENSRLISAHQRRWSWLTVVPFYSGLILLCLAFLISHFSLKSEQITLYPHKLESSQLLGATLDLAQVDAVTNQGEVVITPQNNDRPIKTVTWQLYRPAFLEELFILPVAIDPVLTIEARDVNNELRRLIPIQEDLPPDTQLNLPLDSASVPQYFVIPSDSLAFQVVPVTGDNEDRLNVQVRRGSEPSPSENLMVRLGETFTIDDITVTMTLSHNLHLVVRRDLALPVYGLSLIIIVVSGVLLYFWSPWQVWLVPEVKGRGGQLYGVVEKPGSVTKADDFLEQLLGRQEITDEEKE